MQAITTTPTSSGLSPEALTAAIRQEHEAASTAARSALEHALEAGRLLAEAKATMPHGSWESYVKDSCGIAPRTARLYQRLHRHRERLPNRQHAAEMSVRQAARLLERPKAKAETVLPAVEAEQTDELRLRLRVPEWYRPGVKTNGYHDATRWFFHVWPHPQGEPWVHLIVWCPDNLGSWSHGEGPKRGIRRDALELFLNNDVLHGIPSFDDDGWAFWYEEAPKAASEKYYNSYIFHGDEHYRVHGLGLRPSRKRRRKAAGASA